MKPSPLTVSLTNWPTIGLIRGASMVITTLPLPREGNRGHHVCPAATRGECASCKRRRDRADVQAVRDMFSATGRVAANFKRQFEEWER